VRTLYRTHVLLAYSRPPRPRPLCYVHPLLFDVFALPLSPSSRTRLQLIFDCVRKLLIFPLCIVRPRLPSVLFSSGLSALCVVRLASPSCTPRPAPCPRTQAVHSAQCLPSLPALPHRGNTRACLSTQSASPLYSLIGCSQPFSRPLHPSPVLTGCRRCLLSP